MPKVIPPFDYKNLTGKDPASTTLVKAFVQHKADVASIEGEGKIKRMSGVAYKELALAMADSQHVILRIKDTGDVFQVLVNNKVVPIKNQDNIAKAVIEIVDRLDSGRAAFQKAMLRKKVEAPVPKGIKTAALNMIPTLQERIPALKAEIEAVREERVAIEAERAKSGENQNPIKSENAAVAPPVAENVPVAAVESNKPRAWQEPARAGEDPAGGAAVIEAWDSAKADALMVRAASGANEASVESVARDFIGSHLQGRIVKTTKGDCLISAESKGKLPRAAGRKGGIKLKVIARIPEILVSGEAGELEENNKSRTDTKTGFYPFTKIVKIDEISVEALLKVAQREDAPNLVYNLDVRDVSVMDAVQTENPSFTRRCTGNAVVDLGLDGVSESNLCHTLDAVNSDDGLNIEILHVWDKDGNELDPETLEPINQIPVKKQGADLVGVSGENTSNDTSESNKDELVPIEITGNEPGESAQDEPAQPLAQPENPIIQSMRALLAVPDDALLAQAKAALDDDAALFDDAPDALRHAAHVTATSIQSELAP